MQFIQEFSHYRNRQAAGNHKLVENPIVIAESPSRYPFYSRVVLGLSWNP